MNEQQLERRLAVRKYSFENSIDCKIYLLMSDLLQVAGPSVCSLTAPWRCVLAKKRSSVKQFF